MRYLMIQVAGFLLMVGSVAAEGRVQVIDDQKILKQIPLSIGALVEEKKTLDWKKLNEQLKRGKVKLVLPKAVNEPMDNIYNNRADSVVVVAPVYKCSGCAKWHSTGAATGWVLTADGVMVTNYHVFAGKEVSGFGVMTRDGKFAPVTEILAASKRTDVVIFRVGKGSYKPIPLGPDAKVGSDLHIVAHPDSRFYTYTSGKVSRYYNKRGHGQSGPPVMAVTAEFARGSSGGPTMDSNGNLVGMVSSTKSIYYPPKKKAEKQGPFQMVIRNCVPVSSIRDLLE